jgi:hypothetical protein
MLVLAGVLSASQAADELDKTISVWISQNIRFVKDQENENRETILIGKQAVRADIRSDNSDFGRCARRYCKSRQCIWSRLRVYDG